MEKEDLTEIPEDKKKKNRKKKKKRRNKKGKERAKNFRHYTNQGQGRKRKRKAITRTKRADGAHETKPDTRIEQQQGTDMNQSRGKGGTLRHEDEKLRKKKQKTK